MNQISIINAEQLLVSYLITANFAGIKNIKTATNPENSEFLAADLPLLAVRIRQGSFNQKLSYQANVFVITTGDPNSNSHEQECIKITDQLLDYLVKKPFIKNNPAFSLNLEDFEINLFAKENQGLAIAEIAINLTHNL